MLDFYNTFLGNDQPTTCPQCSARTNFFEQISPVSNKSVEVHTCLSLNCQIQFVVEFDDEFDY